LPPGGRLIGGEAQLVSSIKANKLAWQVFFSALNLPGGVLGTPEVETGAIKFFR
jgi:hypothetical protein